MQASNGQLIKSVVITPTSGTYVDLRQNRIDGIQPFTPVIPEPASLAMAGTALLAGLGVAIRRRRSK